ncbi:MAG: hypothetical protein ACLFWM_03150 [Actinomycetota bacterium]
MTVVRTVLVALAATVGFVVGFYAGVVALLSVVGLDGFRGWQFPLATLPAGGVVGGLAAGLATPGRPWRSVLAAALAGALLVMGLVYLIDADFGVAIISGAAAVAAAASVTAGARSGRP